MIPLDRAPGAEAPVAARLDREALVAAMAIVPGLYARNRHFSLHRQPEVRRARARAAMIRGTVRQLAGAHGDVQGLALARHGEVSVLRYRIPQVHLERVLELSEVERACLLFLAARAGVRGLHPTPEERGHLDSALRRLGTDVVEEALEGRGAVAMRRPGE
ncbi:MAG TPA: hypothetical protein VGI39_38755 [Polyangiaceae bacterium]